MTKRHSKGVRFFCHPDELNALLQPILAKSGTTLLAAVEQGERWYFRDDAPPERSRARFPKFYPCPPGMIKSDGFKSLANIVQVWPPVIEERRLRMGEIGMLVDESELPVELRKLQEDIYRDARKALTNSFRKGVVGSNSKTGGRHFYEDILISDWAARAHADGLVLATIMGDGFVTYHVEAGQTQ